MHKSLGSYKDSPAGKILEDIYGKQITHVYVPSKNQDFTPSFEAMQKILTDARKATGIQFLCFKLAKDKEKESLSRSGTGANASTRSQRKRVGRGLGRCKLSIFICLLLKGGSKTRLITLGSHYMIVERRSSVTVDDGKNLEWR